MQQVNEKILGDLINEYLFMEAQLEEMKRNCIIIRKKIERIHTPAERKRQLTQLEIDKKRIHLQQYTG